MSTDQEQARASDARSAVAVPGVDARLLRVLFERARDGIAIFNQDHRVIEANQSFADQLGYTRDEVLQLHAWDFEASLTEPEIRAAFADLAGINGNLVTRHRRKDGTLYDAEVSASGARIDGQNVVITTTRDVSAQRQDQAALQAREEVFTAIVKQAVDGIVLIDADTLDFAEFNDAACAQLGYSRDEFARLSVLDISEFGPAQVESHLGVVLRSGSDNFLVRHRCKDGTWRNFSASNRRVDLHGKTFLAAIWRDVTEQQKAVEALRLSEERQRLAVVAGQQGLWDLDLRTGVAQVNDIYAIMTGHDPATFSENHGDWLDRMHPDDRLRVQQSFAAYIEGRAAEYRVEFRSRTQDGCWKWILSQGRILEYDASGKPVRMLGSHTDVNDRKLLEGKLRESEFFLRQSQQIGSYGGWRVNPRDKTVMWTDGVYSILELPLDYAPELESGLNFYLPESRARVVDNLQRTLLTGEPFVIEVEVRTSSGKVRWAELRGFPHCDADDSIDYVMGTLQDITRRKFVEIELQNHRTRLEELVSERTAALESANRRLTQSDIRLNAMFDMSQAAPLLSEADLLRHGINEAVRLTASQIGYLHFVNEDQETLQLMTWSTSAVRACRAAHEDHYPVSKGGVWADAVRYGEAVVHNNYQAVAGRKGLPGGHVPLVRHLGVPVLDGGKVRMLLGVGNKPVDYDESDVRELQLIGNDLWRIYTRRHTELQLAEAKEAAEAANRAKSAFLANMSHEIRTPLNAITGFAHLVRESGVTAEQSTHLDQVDAAGAHLLEVLNQVLDLAKIEAGKFVLEEASLDIPGIVANVTAMLRATAQRKGIALVNEVDAIPSDCLGDPTRLRQALLNYATNAAKFTHGGRIVIRLHVEEALEAAVRLRFEVEDTGIGIEPDALGRLFTEFEQADNSMTREHRGTGLGLAITRRLAALMGGEAGAASEPGKGSRFWFTVALKRGKPASGSLPIRTEPSAREILQADYRGRRILVVEDDPVNQMITTMLLRGAGLEVDIAGDGVESVGMAGASKYDAILMDMQMPHLDGPGATRRIRALPGLDRIPVIAMTANAFAEDKALCLEAGMNDFITKPVNPAHLLGTLLEWLRRA